MPRRFESLEEFYPFYLSEHRSRTNRRLHFLGTSLFLLTLAGTVATAQPLWLALLPVFGYGFAWFGHFFIERNRPATFRYPVYSFVCDFRMYSDILRGRIPF